MRHGHGEGKKKSIELPELAEEEDLQKEEMPLPLTGFTLRQL